MFFLSFALLVVISQTQPVDLHVQRAQILSSNEASLYQLQQMIEKAQPGSTVRLGYFILEDDFSSSALVEQMIERAQSDGVKFHILVDHIMSEAYLSWIQFLASLPGFEVRRVLPPTSEFKRYLAQDLGMKDVESFLKGLSLQKVELIKKGLFSSDILLPLGVRFQIAQNLNDILLILSEPESSRIVAPLSHFGTQFEEFSQRFHHKIAMAAGDSGLMFMVEGRNISDEYRLSLETEPGRKFLARRSYPFFDVSFYGELIDAAEAADLQGTFTEIWNATHETVERVQPLQGPKQLEERRNLLFSRVDEFQIYWRNVRAEAKRRSDLNFYLGRVDGVSLTYLENLVTPGPNYSGITAEWIKQINAAKSGETIVIISAYFYPSANILAAFERATKRQVSIRVYTNGSDTTDMNMVNMAAYQAFHKWHSRLGPLFRIFEMAKPAAGKGSLHAKIFYRRGRVLGIGSANTDIRTVELDSNNMIFIPLQQGSNASRMSHRFFDHFLAHLDWVEVTPAGVAARLLDWETSQPRMMKLLKCPLIIRQL